MQLQTCAPHLWPHYYHNLWWERNRSSIRSVGKVTTPKTAGPPFQQRARRGQLACLVCVYVCVCFVINHRVFEESGRRPSLYSLPDLHTSPSRPVAFAPHLTTAQRPRSAWPLPPNLSTQQHPLICDQPSPGVTLHPTSTQTPSFPRLAFPPPRPLCPPVVLETQLPLRPPFSCALWRCTCA